MNLGAWLVSHRQRLLPINIPQILCYKTRFGLNHCLYLSDIA